MMISAATLKVIAPKRKWIVRVKQDGKERDVSVRAREWSEVTAALAAVLAGEWTVLRAS
jgi:hypothetical protein